MTKLKSIWNWPFFIHDYQVIMMDHPMRKQKRWKLMWMNSCHDQSWFATCAKNRERLKSSAIKGQKWPDIQMQTTKCCQPLLSLQWIWFFIIELNEMLIFHHIIGGAFELYFQVSQFFQRIGIEFFSKHSLCEQQFTESTNMIYILEERFWYSLIQISTKDTTTNHKWEVKL